MKRIIALLFLMLLGFEVFAQTKSDNAVNTILSSYSTKKFEKGAVKEDDLAIIVKCGMKAPSARNTQLWKFTVIQDTNKSKKIISDIMDGNILIIISGSEEKMMGVDVVFDCALATENMYLAAQGLGLGAHIYTSPVENINRNLKEELNIPNGYKVISVLRIGNSDKSVDAVSSASKRKHFNEIVNYSK